ncbi:hypothetical protein [Streptomyces sp. NPDC059909]|uniref:hypothetical protein n=1 Tax=Streptomyces sp. NPDC059909 TaxID=3346998 RepID=UPI00364D941E
MSSVVPRNTDKVPWRSADGPTKEGQQRSWNDDALAGISAIRPESPAFEVGL